MKKIMKVFIPIIIVFLLILLFNSFKAVPTGYIGVRTRFGKVSDNVVQEGLNLKVPFIEKIVLMDCRTQKAEIECNTASKDLQEVYLRVAINYNVNRTTAQTLYKEHRQKP